MQGLKTQRNDSKTSYLHPLDAFPAAVAPLEQTSSCVSLSAHSYPLSMRYKIILLNVYSAKIRILPGICLISLKLLHIFNEKRALTSQSQPFSIDYCRRTHVTSLFLSSIKQHPSLSVSFPIGAKTSTNRIARWPSKTPSPCARLCRLARPRTLNH